MKERTVTRTQASGTVRLRDSLNAVLPRDDGMNDAHSRDTAKRCVYEAAEDYIYTEDSNMVLLETVDVFGFKSSVTYKFTTIFRKKKKDYFLLIKILKYESKERDLQKKEEKYLLCEL